MNTLCTLPPRTRARSRLADRVAEALSEQIEQGVFGLGAQLPSEARMANLYAVSRSVIREVICNLQGRGLVATRQGAGTFVINKGGMSSDQPYAVASTLDDVLELFEIRSALEVEAAGLAASRRSELQLRALRDALDTQHFDERQWRSGALDDDKFHVQIARCTGNPYLVSAITGFCSALLSGSAFTHGATRATHRGVLARISHEHEEIYRAVCRNDAPSAQAAMLVHLANRRERLKARYGRLESGRVGV